MALTNEQLMEIRKRAEAATQGPWYNTRWDVATKPDITTGYPSSPESICGTFDGEYIENPNGTNDAEFIAHAREDVPKLLAEIERLRTSLVKIRDSYGNPYNSQDAVIIARNAIQIAKFAVGDSHD